LTPTSVCVVLLKHMACNYGIVCCLASTPEPTVQVQIGFMRFVNWTADSLINRVEGEQCHGQWGQSTAAGDECEMGGHWGCLTTHWSPHKYAMLCQLTQALHSWGVGKHIDMPLLSEHWQPFLLLSHAIERHPIQIMMHSPPTIPPWPPTTQNNVVCSSVPKAADCSLGQAKPEPSPQGQLWLSPGFCKTPTY